LLRSGSAVAGGGLGYRLRVRGSGALVKEVVMGRGTREGGEGGGSHQNGVWMKNARVLGGRGFGKEGVRLELESSVLGCFGDKG